MPHPRPCCHRHPPAQFDSDDGAGFMRGHRGTPYHLTCPANLAAGRFGRAALAWQCS